MPKTKTTYRVSGYRLEWTYRHASGGTSTNAETFGSYADAAGALANFKPDPDLSLIGITIAANEIEETEAVNPAVEA